MGSIPLRAGKSSHSKCEHVTFNHGVEGSSPSALTNEIKYLVSIFVQNIAPENLPCTQCVHIGGIIA
jgi:hypothetical protein